MLQGWLVIYRGYASHIKKELTFCLKHIQTWSGVKSAEESLSQIGAGVRMSLHTQVMLRRATKHALTKIALYIFI